jgi:hypothetical protein
VTCIQKEEEVRSDKYNNHHTIIRIPDKLWDEIKMILPKEKPSRTIGRPVIPYRKVLESILYLEQDVSGRGCFPKNMVQVPPVIVDSKNGIKEVFLKRYGLNY